MLVNSFFWEGLHNGYEIPKCLLKMVDHSRAGTLPQKCALVIVTDSLRERISS